MKTIPHGSKDYQRLNPHLFSPARYLEAVTGVTAEIDSMPPTKPLKRLRQSNRRVSALQQEWFNRISVQNPNYPRPRTEAVTFKLANGVNYTPDAYATEWPIIGEAAGPVAWEVKGKRAWDDAIVKIKVAAHEWAEIHWYLVWKDDDGNWREQLILP